MVQLQNKPPPMPKFPETHLIREGGPLGVQEVIALGLGGLSLVATVILVVYEVLIK